MKPVFKPQTEWLPPESFPDLSKYDEISIDLETKDPDLKSTGSGSIVGNGKVVGIAVAVEGWSGYYPIAHEGGGNMDIRMVINWFTDVLKTPAIKIFHNAMYDVCWIRSMGLKIEGKIVDTMIAGSLVDENRFRYDLGSLGRDYVGIGKSEAVLKETAAHWGIDPKSEMYKLPAMYVGEYAEQDAVVTLKLWQEMKRQIENEDVQSIFDLETELFPCLVDMRFLGVRVDVEAAHKLKQELVKEEERYLLSIKKETGIDVQIWAARSIEQIFKKKDLDYPVTAKTGAPSFTKNFLQNHPNSIVQQIAHAREINKSHTTFIDTILKHSHKGRIHAEINQIRSDQGGTVTGRFQLQQSKPTADSCTEQGTWTTDQESCLFLKKDARGVVLTTHNKNQDLLAHYASMDKNSQNITAEGLEDVLEAYLEHDADFHKIVADMANIPRSQAKTINLGLFYGMGKNKLQAELGLDKADAEELFQKYHGRVPFVKQLTYSVMERAQDSGRIRTLLGRRCRFNLWEPRQFGVHKALPKEEADRNMDQEIKRAYTYKALNKLIQGSAADMTKKAMVDLYKEGIVPHIQVHDELDISVDGNADKIKDIMESAVELEIPNKVDYESGPNWGSIK